ncbi:transposase [Oceanisphaera pacifica]|uniref:Transposase n=1 Tax=Oceanisphaera pacifica TaxID=2818389 RepID=A0ABS3NDX4_9GAMM|nr:transposase [Oceanisphaera pacifica]MBO1518786.1 transposase [Oceanisphaera pacifica]
MPKPRSEQISLEDTPFYHCVSRTVRGAFLCGIDNATGRSFERRRKWLEKRILYLSQQFSIDVAAYAVMSNHLHVVLHVDMDKVQRWSDKKVVKQWHGLFKGTYITQKFAKNEPIETYELDRLNERIAEYRSRLISISWFMRALNEPMARTANEEDDCTGHFWEGRFKSQALLDEAAVLACMTYVDLNPVRAKMANTPEDSHYTSIKQRIDAAHKSKQPDNLLPFIGNEQKIHDTLSRQRKGLLFDVKDYITLVNDMGRIQRDDKRGFIHESTANILERLNIPLENWQKITQEFKYLFTGPVGTLENVTQYHQHLGRKRRSYLSCCQHWPN